MTPTQLILILAVVFMGLLVVAILLWAVAVRPFVRRSGARTARGDSLASLVMDFSTSLIYSRGRLPWTIRIFGGVLLLLVADALLAVLIVLFGT